MDKKFELTNETIDFRGRTLYRIKALKDFGDVKKGDLGGFIEKESNLSQEDKCWIYNDAKVFDNAIVYDNANVYDNAKIYGNVKVYDDANVFGNAQVFGRAEVYNNANVWGNAEIYNNAIVCGYARIYGNARVFGDAKVCDYAEVFDYVEVYDNANISDGAMVYGTAVVYNNAIIKEHQIMRVGACAIDLSKNLKENIRCQTNLIPQKDYVIAYKQVHRDLTSFYDKTFQYKIGEWIEVKDPDMSNEPCATGLHFSNPNYWNRSVGSNTTYLIAKIMLDDIITVQQGKIRCKRAFILDKYEIED